MSQSLGKRTLPASASAAGSTKKARSASAYSRVYLSIRTEPGTTDDDPTNVYYVAEVKPCRYKAKQSSIEQLNAALTEERLRELRALSNNCLTDPASTSSLSYHLAHRTQRLIERMGVSVQVGSISAKTGAWVHVTRENISAVDEIALDQDWSKLPLPQTELEFHFWSPPPAATEPAAQTRAPVASTLPSAVPAEEPNPAWKGKGRETDIRTVAEESDSREQDVIAFDSEFDELADALWSQGQAP